MTRFILNKFDVFLKCIYIYMCVCIYIYTHTHTHTYVYVSYINVNGTDCSYYLHLMFPKLLTLGQMFQI